MLLSHTVLSPALCWPFLEQIAYKALRGVGDASRGQWIERGGAFHLRRRLNAHEDVCVGGLRDLRQTEDGWARYRTAIDRIPPQARALALEEIQDAPLYL